jgi:hypothetical protein
VPIFSRRRLQAMIDDLAPYLDDRKARDIIGRLENKRVEQCLPAEMELGLIWAVSQLGPVDIEPYWWADGKAPDLVTEALFPGVDAVIEVLSVDDNSLSGEDAMLRIARQFTLVANKTIKGSGAYLYFEFATVREGSFRYRATPTDYEISEIAADKLREWLRKRPDEKQRLQIIEDGLSMSITMKRYRMSEQFMIFSSMPPQADHLEHNPLYASLTSKLRQLRAAPKGCLKLIFVADAGSTLLRRIGTFGEGQNRFSGTRIIERFFTLNRDKVDGVMTFAPQPKSRVEFWRPRELNWKAAIATDHPIILRHKARLDEIVAALPKPIFESYQAKSLHQQGLFKPQNLMPYLGTTMHGKNGDVAYKVSARLVLDLLAGKLDQKRFRDLLGERDEDKNFFANLLEQGLTLRDVQCEPAGVDEDDDYLVLKFSVDPAAGPLRTPKREGLL